MLSINGAHNKKVGSIYLVSFDIVEIAIEITLAAKGINKANTEDLEFILLRTKNTARAMSTSMEELLKAP